MEDHMKKVFEHMKGSQIPQADLSEDEFKTCLYGKSADRLEIIQWMVSELHDKYKLNLQKRIGNGLKLDLSRILANLQFVSSADKLAFVQGTLPLEEQEKVVKKMFRGLSLILFPCNVEREFDLTETTNYRMSKRPKRTQEKKRPKPFDFNRAWANIKAAKSFLSTMNDNLEMLPLEKHDLPPPEPVNTLSKETVAEVLRGSAEFAEKFGDIAPAMRHPTIRITNLENLEACDGTLESAVTNLYSTLSDIMKVFS